MKCKKDFLVTAFAVYSNVLKGKGANELWTFSVALKEISHFAHYCNLGSTLLCRHVTSEQHQNSKRVDVYVTPSNRGKFQVIEKFDN